MLKPLGYTNGQFGKNHLGDRNEFLPTVHGFDEFFGNLYHLNAEEEPEHEFYPKDPAFRQRFGPRGVLHCYATETSDPTTDPRFGVMGKQKCEDTGPLTRKRMETVDEEFVKASIDFMGRANKAGKPFFVWFNSTRMHIFTHLKPASKGKTGLGVYADGMVEHDGQVGELLTELKTLGIENNTIVIYTTDNGAEILLWPDGGMTPFHGEKNTTWEGGFRAPMMVKWPGHIKPGGTSNDIISLLDWVPTLMAAAGQPDVKDRLLKGIPSEAIPTRSTSTDITSCRCWREKVLATQGVLLLHRRWSLSAFVTKTGKCCFRYSARMVSTSGRSHMSRCEFQCCSICEWIPSSAPKNRKIMRAGASTICG